MKVTAKRKYEQLKVYIEDILHLQIKLIDLIGFQSWIHGTNEYFIEYYFVGGAKITTAYGEKDRWIEVLKVLDSEITTI